MEVSIVMGVPQRGWFIMGNPTQMHDNWGYPHFLGNLMWGLVHILWMVAKSCS